MIKSRKQSTTDYPITFLMVDSADHVTGKTGLTPTVTISKNGGAFGAASGAVSEIANGWYKLAGHAGDRDTLGELLIHASASGADPADLQYCIVEYDPFGFAGDIVGADGDTLESLSDQLDTAQADLDNPSQYMADVSGLATAADLATVDGVVDAIKTKTDLLPADPAGVSDVPTSGDIADAVWDELLSGHVISGSTGAGLSTAAAGSAGSGAGANEVVITVNDGSNPLDGVEVWVTTDIAGSNTVASGISSVLGTVTVYLDPGTYYVWKQLAGYTFTNPETMVV